MEKKAKIYVAGHRGLVGSSIMRALQKEGYENLVYKSSEELDLRNFLKVEKFFETEKPEYVFLSAAKVGGIKANIDKPVEFLLDNISIQNNVISSCHKYKVKKLLFLGSSCIYPKLSKQPIKEEYLMTGELEPTNEGYALAKISGLKLCQYYRKEYNCDFISVMPSNIYGIEDNFDLETSHVLPAFIRRFHEAKINNKEEVVIWGSGKAKREFMYSDDIADGLLYLMENYSEEIHLNLGTGEDIEVGELAKIIKDVVGYKGKIKNDLSKPDGMSRKLLDVSRLRATGYRHKVELREGIEKVYKWFLENENTKK